MSKKVIRQIIQDEPTKTDLFHGGGHERTAHSLSRAIVKFDEGDRAIGLDGSWGSGKSSVVEMAARKLKEQNGKGKKTYHFFTFDIWKSQGSGFRRSYLEHFISWAKQNFTEKKRRLDEIEKQIQGKTKEIETNNQPILDWYGVCVLVFLPFLPLYYFWAKSAFDTVNKDPDLSLWNFLGTSPFLVLLSFLVITLISAAYRLERKTGETWWSSYRTSISRLLLISSRQHQDQKVVQRVREIDPNDYEFHSTLREILSVVQTDKDRVVVVLDNIDRLPRKEIKEYWALVRSIFSRTQGETSPDKNADITAIVPYDRKLIEANVNEDDETEANNQLTSLASRELFSKTFDEILVVAPPVLSNAREFFADKLDEALPKQVSTDDRFKTYRIFCELLSVEGGVTTPRQIVSFVNDLSSLYELQDGRFELPTVAAFIAHQDSLSDNPSILNEEGGLNAKIVSLTANSNLVKHLASMVFNVDEELAFQILLDDEIASAFISDSTDDLVKISSAPGFDYRVDDVLQDHIDEWTITGDLKQAIGNAAELLVSYTGDAKDYITRAILDGFKKVESISVEEEEYLAYMHIFKLAANGSLDATVRHYTEAAMKSVNGQENPNYSNGINVSKFLSESDDALASHGGHDALRTSLLSQKLPMSPDFIFGLSATISDSGFKLADFGSTTVGRLKISRSFPKVFGDDADPEYFVTEFPQHPTQALKALLQYKECKILTDTEWVSVANACLLECKDEELNEGKAEQLLEIVALTWQHVDEKKRPDIELDEALQEGRFFRNLGDGGGEAQALLLFLCREKLGETLANPTKLQPNGTRAADSSDAFVDFKGVLEGDTDITASQASTIAVRAIDSRKASRWMGFGSENPEHTAVRTIVENMFEQANPPYLNFPYFLEQFSYIRSIVSTEKLSDVLKKYAGRVSEDDISKLKISDVPSGFLEATHRLGDGYWDAFHSKVDNLLHSIDASAWPEQIRAMDATVDVLVEKLGSSGCKLDGGTFRAPYIEVIKDVLAGQTELEASDGALDQLLTAIDEKYHEEIWRTLRETVSGVTGSSLTDAMRLCPKLIANVAQNGSSISKNEKDNVLRNLLIPALEGRNSRALRIFAEMTYARLKDFQGAAQDGTNNALEAAWKSYSDADVDRDLKRDLSEALFGKRKAKSILDPSFWNPLLK